MKDNFSKQAASYAKFRPEYPHALYEYILFRTKGRSRAWDCATGNGQVAKELSKHFEEVLATDMSQRQLDNAFQSSTIQYSISAAEKTNFPDNHFDLITVGQALHWFKFDTFFKEAKRVLKPTGVLAVWGYSNMQVNEQIDVLNFDFYHTTTGPYWDPERKHIDNHYNDINFPFDRVESAEFEIIKEWDLKTLEGFFNTWSSVQHFIKNENYNPVPGFIKSIKPIWNDSEIKKVKFPIFLKLSNL